MQLVTTGVEGLSEDAITISPRLESVSRTTRSFFGYMACRETMTYSGEAETSKKQLTRLKRDRQENPIAFWVSEDLQWDPHVQPKTSQKDARFPEESNSPSSTASRPRIGRKAQLAHQWRVFVHSAPADLGGIAMALTSVFFRRRLLLLPLFVCIAAGPVDDTWPGAHGLPPADTTEQGLLWLWRLLRPLLPLPINIAGLIWSGVLLMRRVKAKAPCGKFSMLFFFITISGPVTLAICYGISTPDDRDLAVMTSICLFFAYPFATHLGCLLVHNVRIYTVYAYP
ncbi:uncharacterized protein RHO25_003553 [Cercospora beticola]|uniref:Uncharacterized protein n=1 Tax=Cercospora beticola TaxID=122368 RepID=A0ABZ0NHE4_CERBT|nr:hypothetical protein RHO25_003553 [Cercospora beticola]